MRRFMLLLCAALVTAACSAGGGGETSATEGAQNEDAGGGASSVEVRDFEFDPETASVATGEEVTWTLTDASSDHTVTFEDEDSGTLSAGETYSRTFDEAGEYPYVCAIHPQMTGTVTVE